MHKIVKTEIQAAGKAIEAARLANQTYQTMRLNARLQDQSSAVEELETLTKAFALK